MADHRIDGAAHAPAENAADATLIAGDAGPDSGAAPLLRLHHQHGIGDHAADNIDHVRLPRLDGLLRIVERTVAADDDARHADAFADPVAERQLIAGRLIHSRVTINVKVVVAVRDVDEIDQPLGLRVQGDGIGVFRGQDALIRAVADPYTQHEICRRRRTDGAQRFQKRADAILKIPAVLVGALIQDR